MRLRLRFSKGPSSRLNSYVRQIRDSRRRGPQRRDSGFHAAVQLVQRAAPLSLTCAEQGGRACGSEDVQIATCSQRCRASVLQKNLAKRPGAPSSSWSVAATAVRVLVVTDESKTALAPWSQQHRIPHAALSEAGDGPGSERGGGGPASHSASVCVTQARGLQRQVRVSDGGGCGCGCRGPRTRAEWSVRARKRWGRMTERENAIPERRGAYAQGGMARDKGWWSPPPALQPTGQASAQWPLQCAQCVRLPAPSAATTAPMRSPPTASPASPAPNVEARPAGPQAAQPAAALLASAPAQSAHPSARLWPGSCWPQPCHPPLTDSGGPPPQFFPSLFALPPRPSLTLVLNLHGTGSSLVHQSSTTPPRLFPPVSSVLPPSPPPPRRRGTLQPKTPTATCAVRPLRYRAWSAQSEVLADALEGHSIPKPLRLRGDQDQSLPRTSTHRERRVERTLPPSVTVD
ncbi:hypothetical protein ACCO45_006548 [Purpureocillium lilacinum]|uniref:Uncharacterized protein n=1 Tax=Purpureocillium lilacinum TaxID=33203 RepID=A0ACC4DQ55_PURLI